MTKTTSNRNRRYIPDPLGRLGQGHWVDGKPRDPLWPHVRARTGRII